MATQPLEPIMPFPWLLPNPNYASGVPSVLLPHDPIPNGTFSSNASSLNAPPPLSALYLDLTGNLGSLNVSFGPGFRKALVGWSEGEINGLGENSYFGESAYELEGWGGKYRGGNAKRLREVKKWDPRKCFGAGTLHRR
jgi:hypothetical protein